MSITANFLKLRSTDKEIKLNQWHNGFSACKKFAESKKVPFIAVWSNGDKCGHCTMFEQCLMDSKFKTWMKTSQCVFWFGYYGDKSKDDTFEGTGFTWCYNKGAVTQYPFVRIYWKDGKVDVTRTGGKLTGDTAKGATKLVTNFKSFLKNYKPQTEVTQLPTTENSQCDNCQLETPVYVPPIVSMRSNEDGTYCVLANGKSLNSISETDASYIVGKCNA